MASTYVNNLRLNEMATGDGSGTWGTTTNTNLELIGQALGYGTRAIANASTDNITIADGASDSDRAMYLKLTGGGQACTVTLLPNTASKVWMMENATSYTLTFTCGSGANVAILAGETKVIATDGAGSGGVVYDVLTDTNLAGTTKVDDLTVGDDLVVGGDIDLEGAIDVNGTANLDVVDIDGAVNMATTALVTGVLTTTATQVATGGITSGSSILSDTDSTDSLGSTGVRWLKGWFDTLTAGTLTIGSGSVTDSSGAISFGNENLTTTGIVTAAGTSVFTNLDISGDVDVDGTTNLDVVDIDGAVDMASTLAVAGVLTGASLDISGDIDIDGTSNLDIVDVDGAVNFAADVTYADGADIITASAGTSNVRVGVNAGNSIASGGNYNVVVGDEAGTAINTGDSNVAVGMSALAANTTGGDNVGVGHSALLANTGATNTAVGNDAGKANTTGGYNVFLGRDAGITGSPGGNNTTGNGSIFLGDENIGTAHIQVDWTVASDQRDKTDFTALDLGLDFVKALAPVTYRWDKRSKYGDKTAEGYDLNAQSPDGTHKEDWLDVGFKAQAVQALEEAAGYTTAAKKNLTVSTSGDGKQMGLQYSKFVPILVKAIQEQQTLIEALTARITTLEG